MIMFLKMSVSRLITIGSLVLWAETDEVKQTSRCDVKINNETVLNVSKTNKTFTFNDYSSTLHYFDEGQYGIVLQGNS